MNNSILKVFVHNLFFFTFGGNNSSICFDKCRWTKSKYAYLNQPALDSMDPPKKRASTYVPNCLSYQPKALYPTAIGVF